MFALFHGNVHAIELPDAGAAWLYVSGFLIGTAGIHVGGIMVADIMRKPDGHSRFITLISALVIAIGVTFAIKQLNP